MSIDIKKIDIIKRILSGALMISLFSFMVYNGPRTMIFTVLFLQFNCIKELYATGYNFYPVKKQKQFINFIIWMLIFVGNLYFFPKVLSTEIYTMTRSLYPANKIIFQISHYVPFLGFLLYCVTLILFVKSLTHGEFHEKFTLFSWMHFSMLIYITTAKCHIYCISQGSIWFLLPVILIIANDIFAFFVGRHYGHRKLINLSPNKTLEGFLGAALLTLLLAPTLAHHMGKDPFFTHVIHFNETSFSYEYQKNADLTHFKEWEINIFQSIKITWSKMKTSSLIIGLFVSFIGPFGGFMASGLKRAFSIKDFATTIPGHGGFLDRFDCQPLVSLFVLLYYDTFIKS